MLLNYHLLIVIILYKLKIINTLLTCICTADKDMKGSQMAGIEFISTKKAKAFHAESAGKMIAIFSLFNHFIAERTHLNIFAFCGSIIKLI